MAENTIQNGCNIPLNFNTGFTPDVSGALQNYYQPMTFNPITKTLINGFVSETEENTTPFWGTISPFTERQLLLKPEGQRAWTWFLCFAQPVFTLQVDDVIDYQGIPTRVMSRANFVLYGYVQYHLVQDWQDGL